VSEPLRVLQLITELRPGGAERIVYELARGLPRERYAVQVCSLRPATGAVADWLSQADIRVHSLEVTGKVDFAARARLAKLLRAERIQVLHTHLFHANVLGRWAARPAGLPSDPPLPRGGERTAVIGTVHIVERRFLPWRFWIERWTLRPRDVVICVSEAVRRFTAERGRIPATQLRVIWNGVDLSRFAASAEPAYRAQAAAELRRELQLPQGTPLAIAVGRLDPQKGYPDLLVAWAHLARNARSEVPSAVLAIVGEGSQRKRLERFIARHGLGDRVRLLGQRDDVPWLLAGADLFVSSSRYEGLALALLEALASGLPVVATAVESVPEVLTGSAGILPASSCTGGTPAPQEMPGAGLLVPPRQPVALAEAVSRVLGMPLEERAALGRAARVRAQEFSLSRMLEGYARLYDEVHAGGGRPEAGGIPGA
jgi:glycosyltransferase involved in cell wall biosynthesis